MYIKLFYFILALTLIPNHIPLGNRTYFKIQNILLRNKLYTLAYYFFSLFSIHFNL